MWGRGTSTPPPLAFPHGSQVPNTQLLRKWPEGDLNLPWEGQEPALSAAPERGAEHAPQVRPTLLGELRTPLTKGAVSLRASIGHQDMAAGAVRGMTASNTAQPLRLLKPQGSEAERAQSTSHGHSDGFLSAHAKPTPREPLWPREMVSGTLVLKMKTQSENDLTNYNPGSKVPIHLLGQNVQILQAWSFFQFFSPS